MSCSRKTLVGRSGEEYIDVAVLILCVMLVLVLSVKILPVFIARQQLDTPMIELCRETEVVGRTRSETNRRAAVLREKTGLSPEIHWSVSGQTQFNEEVMMQLTYRYNPGLFGGLGSFPITLRVVAAGKSEVYWK